MSRDGFVFSVCVLGFLASIIIMVVESRTLATSRAEIQKLREAFAVVVEKTPLSCELAKGERVICAEKDGTISRLVLAADDQVVSARAVGAPLGKKLRNRRTK